jgi:hypothetical protein
VKRDEAEGQEIETKQDMSGPEKSVLAYPFIFEIVLPKKSQMKK